MTKVEKKFFVPDIECDSCSRLIQKKFNNEKGIIAYSVEEDGVAFTFEDELVDEKKIISKISSLGFRVSEEPFERKTFKERLRDFRENKSKYVFEKNFIKYALGLFILLSFIELIFYLAIFKNIPGFFSKYLIWLIYLNLSVAFLSASLWHIFSYRSKVTCMVGMMIGMTTGMQTGMMLGAVIGATNGFFTGALAGMVLGVIAGIFAGKCCGIMGIMEGMMAGVMGGTMGSMISVMMFSDNIHIFMPVYFVINLVIIVGLSYMFYEEAVENKSGVEKKPIDFSMLAALAVILTVILLFVILYGPKSGVAAFI